MKPSARGFFARLPVLAVVVLSGCGAPGEQSSWPDDSSLLSEHGLVFGGPAMTSARERVTLLVDDADPSTAPIQVTADMPAQTTSKDLAERLALLLRESRCPATIDEAPTAGRGNPESCEVLWLPPGYRATSVVFEKWAGTGWGPIDLHDLGPRGEAIADLMPRAEVADHLARSRKP